MKNKRYFSSESNSLAIGTQTAPNFSDYSVHTKCCLVYIFSTGFFYNVRTARCCKRWNCILNPTFLIACFWHVKDMKA